MNKWLWAVCAVWFAPAFCAGQNNNVRMVTYFPVPYAAYNSLDVSGNCDVGLAGSCSLKSGGEFTVKNKMNVLSGALTLNGGNIRGNTLNAGSGSSTAAQITFGNTLDVNKVPNPIHILESEGQTTISGNLKLKGADNKYHVFPACDAEGHQIVWRQLQDSNGSKIYLTCGGGACVNEAQQKDRCENHERSTWRHETCTCDCPDGQHWSEETGQCETNCSADSRDRCLQGGHDNTAGTWDESTCTCTCPEGYYLEERWGACEAICSNGVQALAEKERCEDGHNRGRWDWSICSCQCPLEGEVWNAYTGECEKPCYIWEWTHECGYDHWRCLTYSNGTPSDDWGDCDGRAVQSPDNEHRGMDGRVCFVCAQCPHECDFVWSKNDGTCGCYRYGDDTQGEDRDPCWDDGPWCEQWQQDFWDDQHRDDDYPDQDPPGYDDDRDYD